MAEGDFSEPTLRYDSREDKVSFVDVQRDPLITAKDDVQSKSLLKTAMVTMGVQEIENRSFVKSGPNPNDPMHKSMSSVMDKAVNEALQNGADEYAILSTIHSATKLADKHPFIDFASKMLTGAKKLFSKKAVA